MKKIEVTTKTSDEITAAFEAVFKNVEPVQAAKVVTLEERLAPYRKAVLRQRRRGLSWKQIAEGMADPRIGEKVSLKGLRQVFGAKQETRKENPVVTRLALDRATGRIVPVPRAGGPTA